MNEDQDLLAQLNGATPDAISDLPGFVDGSGAPAPTREAELTIKPKAVLAPAQALDAVHATAAGGEGYRVRVAGNYYARNPEGKGKIKKAIPAGMEFNVPKLAGCLSLIKNRLLKPALKKFDPAFEADRECRIVSYKPLGNAVESNNLAFVNRERLEAFAREQGIPVDLRTFTKDDAGTAALRESVIDHEQNPDPVRKDDKGRNTVKPGDRGTFLFRERLRQEQRVEAAQLAALNPGLEVA